jgi:hypothetical protein
MGRPKLRWMEDVGRDIGIWRLKDDDITEKPEKNRRL